ncbi:hypothetical protein BGZ75_006870 [Mortierella antarctica]|nr:hypothetical protein BGZ75_006870 [Mortierella antarctica]
MARRQSCSDLPPTSIIPPFSRSSSPPYIAKVNSHSKSASTDMRSSVKSRIFRNLIGQNGQQEYKVLERSLARFHQKDRYRIEVLKTNLLPWLKKDQPSLESLSEASLKTGRSLIMQWWTTLLAVLPDALYTDRCHYFECIIALMTRKEFDEFDRLEDMMSKPSTPSTVRTFVDGSGNGSPTEHTSSTTSVSSSTTLGSGYPFNDSDTFCSSFHQYRKTLTQSLQYAIERLNQKGVYSNVITFCAKILALCFFKLPGVAFGLLHALPSSRSYISRMAKAMDLGGENCGMPQIVSFFPEHLSSICFVGSGSWWREFEKQKRKVATGEAVPPMEMFGNWVRRWQSDDSELFFAFYRHYHHCLAQYLEAPIQRIQAGGWASSAITPKVYAGSPGYLYLSAFFLTKIEGLVHREIHPVTTIVQFEPNAANGNGSAERDRAMASVATGEFPGTAAPPAVKVPNGADAGKEAASGGSTTGKPKVLDMASRRFVETIVAIMEDHGNIYGAMLDIWIKAVVTRTSVYDVESVFCLLDFLDMLIAELESRKCIHLYDSELSAGHQNAGLDTIFIPIHVPFILSTLHLLLIASDHTVTLMRTISFIYQNFSLLTGTVQTLEQLTLGTLLLPEVFEKCFLHWARNVRLYYMRCLVWRVARIGGGVGILPGWKPWTSVASTHSQEQRRIMAAGGMMASNAVSVPASSFNKRSKDSAAAPRGPSIEQSLAVIVRNIFEVMESRIDMVKRQYAGELSEVMSTQVSEKDTESSPSESAPSSPGTDNDSSSSTARDSPTGSSPPSRQRSHSDVGVMQDDESRERARSFYQLQAHQIYISHQTLTSSDGGSSLKEKDKSKKSASRSSLIGRKFRRLSRSDHHYHGNGTVSDIQPRGSFQDGDIGVYDPSVSNSTGGSPSAPGKRSSTGSAPMTAGSLFRWMFLGGSQGSSKSLGQSSNGSSRSNSSDVYASGKSKAQPLGSSHSLASHTSSSSSTSLTMMNSSQEQSSPDAYRPAGVGATGRSYSCPHLASNVGFGLKSRKYPEHLTTYAGRSIPEHTAVLNEYVDWLAQCHAYGIKSRMSYAANGGSGGSQNLPGGVPGIGLGSNNSSNGLDEESGDFSVFSLSMGGVVDVSAVVGHHDEWISPGMAQMMMLRFPGLVVEWPKFWNNNSRESSSGPPPGPITTMTAMAVVNCPALTLAKGNAGGVGTGISAGAGGPFGGASLNGPMGGPSSLKHQQQAQMHHQQQMQLWSRTAAAAAAAATAAAAAAAQPAHPTEKAATTINSAASAVPVSNSRC